MTAVILALVLCATVAHQTLAATDCYAQINTYNQCLRTQMAKDNTDPTASTARRNTIQNDVQTCCSQAGCQNPFPAQAERNNFKTCMNQVRTKVRNDLQSCVQQKLNDRSFKLPNDNEDQDGDWQWAMLRASSGLASLAATSNGRQPQLYKNQQNNDICKNDQNKRRKAGTCLQQKGTFKASNSTWKTKSCALKTYCAKNMDRTCQGNWNNKTQPAICSCVSTVKNSLTQRKTEYRNCAKTKNLQVRSSADEGEAVIDGMLSSWCPTNGRSGSKQRDPCKNRRKKGGKGNGRGGGGSGSNGRPNNGNGNSNNNWNNGHGSNGNTGSNGNNNWNNGNSGSNGNNNWNNGNNGNTGSGGDYGSYDYSWNYGDNWQSAPSDQDWTYDDYQPPASTDPFASLFSSFGSSSSSSSSGGGLFSGLGGGLLGGGGGSPLDALSGLTGGGGASPLGGLGGGLGGLGGFGGSPLDSLGSLAGGGGLLSSIGKKKK